MSAFTLIRASLIAELCVAGLHTAALAELRVVRSGGSLHCFGGRQQMVKLVVENLANEAIRVEARIVLVQASSATALRGGDAQWKSLQLLPRQMVVESAPVVFPAVQAETRFLIQWLEGTNRVFGTTEVLVYPTNLLAQLKALAGEEPLGVFDPANELKPLLRAMAMGYQDLAEDGTDKFLGQLAIFGPFESKQQMRERLADDIRALAQRGVAVVWLQPPPDPPAPLKPSFYTVRVGDGAVVVAQGEMVVRFAENPEAQLNLIRFAEMALRPVSLDLPETRNPN